MAAFLRHGAFKTGQHLTPEHVLMRSYATKAEKKKGIDRKVGPKIDSTARSLAAKGKSRSTIDAVFDVVSGVIEELEQSNHTALMLCDLSKAFDCVSHDILLEKLNYYGVRGIPLHLIRTYLTNHQQAVMLNGTSEKTSHQLHLEYEFSFLFLRPQKSYTPSGDVDGRLNSIFHSVLGTSSNSTKLTDLNQKFALLCKCEEALGHGVPNSMLHHLETLKDVRNFFATPVDTTTPYDKLRNIELPENLSVQFEYHRFHPETDTAFGGVTAFPESSTIVTGLRYKDKYPGYKVSE